eukprot:scaffold142779_cov75-Cyclotella_meneghiniana.AAC.5
MDRDVPMIWGWGRRRMRQRTGMSSWDSLRAFLFGGAMLMVQKEIFRLRLIGRRFRANDGLSVVSRIGASSDSMGSHTFMT